MSLSLFGARKVNEEVVEVAGTYKGHDVATKAKSVATIERDGFRGVDSGSVVPGSVGGSQFFDHKGSG